MDGTRIIDLTDRELVELITRHIKGMIDPIEKRISKLEEALALQAPSFDREYAALYCGNKSVGFIDNAVRKHGLPRIKAGGQSTRYLRVHLDHYLTGGSFTDDGHMIANNHPDHKNTRKKRTELKKIGS